MRSITEAKVSQLYNRLYGQNPLERLEKLDEEIAELKKEIIDYESETDAAKRFDIRLKLSSEYSDALSVLTQIGQIYSLSNTDALSAAIEKSLKREKEGYYEKK